jgi:GTPase
VTSATGNGYHSGFGCLVGRPNTGKSTLMNALVGQKVAIASDRPQTTRHAIRGVIHRPDRQLVVVDTPGLHKPRTLLGERLNTLVRETWAEVDVIAMCFPADARLGPGDTYLATEVAKVRGTPVIAVVTKADTVRRERLARRLLEVQEAASSWGLELAHIVPTSAQSGEGIGTLTDVVLSMLPPGPKLYPDGEITDEPERVLIAELVREAALAAAREELPHSLAAEVTELIPRPGRENDPLLDVYVTLYVERDSQKPIVLGRGGTGLRDIGIRARHQIEALLGQRVNLQLHISVLKDWQRDPRHLHRLGF